MKMCQCEGGPTKFRFHDFAQEEAEGMLGFIFCRDCGGLYRPSHRTHEGDGTPNKCQFCQEYLGKYAPTQEAQKT